MAWVVLIVSFLLVAGIQAAGALFADRSASPDTTTPIPAAVEPTEQPDQLASPAPPPTPPEPIFEMVAKLTIATATNIQPIQSQEELEQTIELVGGFARSDADQIRIAIMAGELGREIDPESLVALKRLGSIEPTDADLDADIQADIQTLSDLFFRVPIDQEDQTRLTDRYPFFGEIALAHDRGTDETVPVIEQLSGLLYTYLSGIVIGGMLLLIGIILLLIAVIGLLTGKLKARFVPPPRGGSVYLEAAAVFVAGFLVLKGVLMGVDLLPIGGVPKTLVALGLQWFLLAAALWPMYRGERFHDWSLASGWHRGSGIIKEILWGVLGWIASIPVFLAAGLFSAALVAAWKYIQGDTGEARSLPDAGALDLIASGNIALIIAMTALATIWAPLAEESIFRGCLYRHVRSRFGVLISSSLVAAIFGFMHGYGVLFVPPVIALGFCFSMMREWRGSLIAPVTAHLLHNATLTTFMILITQLMG